MAINFNISELKLLSKELTEKVGMPFDQMTHSFLKRRLTDVFEKQGFKKKEQLIDGLKNSLFCDDLRLLFSVHTTELFRDASFWRYLRKIISERYTNDTLNIWLPDIASGEELYSLLILLDENNILSKTKIVVNHTSAKVLNQVKEGVLLARKMDVNAYNYKRFEGADSLDKYYKESYQGFDFNSDLLKDVVFVQGDMLSVPAEASDIILFRNSMLYYNKEYHVTLKECFDKALKPGGYLCLGVKETLPMPFEDRFEIIESKEKIYSKYRFLKD